MMSAEAEGSRPDDVALLAGAAGGDPVAVRRLLDQVAPIVYGFLFARVGGDRASAEDLLQETLLEAVRSARGFRGESTLSTWLCSIAKRRLARYYEAERRTEAARHGLRLVGEDDGAEEFEEMDRRDEVVRALGRLSPVHRQVLVLKYLDNLSVADVAEPMGRSAVQIQSLLARARQALKHELGASYA
jgi:RNA polymerase sigma factor (sigma-70 family)